MPYLGIISRTIRARPALLAINGVVAQITYTLMLKKVYNSPVRYFGKTVETVIGEHMSASNKEPTAYKDFLNRLDERSTEQGLGKLPLAEFAERITPEHPLVYWSMEIYDKDENDIKGGGGLGVLAADTRRQCEQLSIPQVVMTPFYTHESHQVLTDFWQNERTDLTDPHRLYRHMGQVSISTVVDPVVPLDVFHRELGSTRIIAVTEPNFGELYPGGNSDDHRLYQEVALGFGGYKALKEQGIDAPFMQLNEAPTVFAAIARLDDLCQRGMAFDEAFSEAKHRLLYTNHTLVPAVEGQFSRDQFEHMVLPNIITPEVRTWVMGMFGYGSRVRLSSLAIELAETKSGVSKLHARVSRFIDRNGQLVHFEAVTNGISRQWIPERVADYYQQLGVLDEFDLPTNNLKEKLESLDINVVHALKRQGRDEMNEVLAHRQDQYGNPIHIPEDAVVFDFKRRFASYKRPDMIFSDPAKLADILADQDAHFLLTGKPHPNDEGMKHELQRILTLIDSQPVLKERVHYIQDYDEEVGRNLAIGADCAINVPVVGEEACGTSWMKDIANFKVLISTPDGGVADVLPIECLEVSGDEQRVLYERMIEATQIIRDDTRLRAEIIREVGSYLPVISGSRMMGEYLQLFREMQLPAIE